MLKQERLNKIIKPDIGKTVIVPMDHGISCGPIKGLINMAETLEKIKKGGADAVVLHKGIIKQNKEALEDLPYLVHISGSSDLGVPLRKVLVADVKECAELGAVGVSIHVNLGNKYEPYMMEDLGQIARDCQKEQMPLLAMMYVRDQQNGEIVNDTKAKSIAHAARVAYELGADIVKVNYTGNSADFKQIVAGCKIPVVIAGGSKLPKDQFLEMVKEAIAAGARGVSCGRNVFQADSVTQMVQEVCRVVR